jgi:oligopeptide/dipeptide ABC transporter ATP-binding protein
MAQLLQAHGVSVRVSDGTTTKDLISEVSLSIGRGETLVLAGESGSGKTILSRALTRLFPAATTFQISGAIVFDGQDVLRASHEELQSLRRSKVRYVFQEPQQALNPLTTVRSQLRLSAGKNADERDLAAALHDVGLHDAKKVLEKYPHQLSIGMAQRVMLAMGVIPHPKLVIADEPTSALDASLRIQILDLLQTLCRRFEMALLLITHDLSVARAYGDRVMVLRQGQVIETAPTKPFFLQPFHPYCRLMLDHDQAHFDAHTESEPSTSTNHDDLQNQVAGCRFFLGCPTRREDCKVTRPELQRVDTDREVRCTYWR